MVDAKRRYEIFGPYPFRTGKGMGHRQALREFWNDRNEDGSPEGLSTAVGVYVWTIRQGNKWVPWNVGLTNRQGFGVRFKQKETTFLLMLDKYPKAQFEVYLLGLRSKTGRFRKPTNSQTIEANQWLETMLIGSAISVNRELRNTSKAKHLKNTVVDGYLNDKIEERSESAKSFNALFKA